MEEGGVGEKLQARNLDPKAEGSITNPRKIFIYNPASSTKVLTNSAHAFTTANAAASTPRIWGWRTIPRRTN